MSARWMLVLALCAVTCGPKAPPQPAGQPEPAAPVDAAQQNTQADAAVPEPVVPDPACVPDCLAWYPQYPDSDGAFHRYCEEYCAPTESPNMSCVSGCMASRGPSAYIDDEGNYQTYEDERTEEDIQSDREACEDECGSVPTIGNISGCVTACVESGEAMEGDCSATCDPNPYDECDYTPCD